MVTTCWVSGDCLSVRWVYRCLITPGLFHYNDVIMNAITSQITSLTIVCSNAHSGADQRKHLSSASLAFVRGIHRWPVNSPHKGPVTRKCFHLMTLSCPRKMISFRLTPLFIVLVRHIKKNTKAKIECLSPNMYGPIRLLLIFHLLCQQSWRWLCDWIRGIFIQ